MNQAIQPRIGFRTGAQNVVNLAQPLDTLAFAVLLLTVAVIPTEDPLVIGENLGLVKVIAALGFCLTAIVVIGRRKLSRINPALVLLACFVTWALISSMWSVSPEAVVRRTGTYLQLLLFFWMVWELARDHRRVRLLLSAFLVGNLVPLTAIFYSSLIGLTFWGGRYLMLGADPNDTALSLAISMTVALYFRATADHRIVRWLSSVYIPLALLAVLMTGSRGGLIAALAGLLLYGVTGLLRNGKNAGYLTAIVLLSVMALPAVLRMMPLDLSARLSDIPAQLQSGTLSGRRSIWAVGIETFLDHPICGVGAGNFVFFSSNALGKDFVEHNAFLAICVEVGIVGATFYFGALLWLLRRILRLPAVERQFYLSAFMCWSVGALSLTWDYRKISWLLIATAAAHVRVLGNRRRGSIIPRALRNERGIPWKPQAANVAEAVPGVAGTIR